MESKVSVIYYLCSQILLLTIPIESASSQIILNEEFWYEFQPLVWVGERGREANAIPDLDSFTKEELYKRILEEARYVFSGMVYGFTFSYTPADRSRRVEEEFTLEPYQWIQPGDPNLRVHSIRREGTRVYVRFRYTLRDFQEAWFRGFRSNIIPVSAGIGEASFFYGEAGRIQAVQRGIQNAIREYARAIMHNRPKTLRGIAALDDPPRMVLDSGVYRAILSRVCIRLEEVKRYRVH